MKATFEEQNRIVHMWEPFSFHTRKGYDFLRSGWLRSLWYSVFRRFAEGVLFVYTRLIVGMRTEGRVNAAGIRGGAVVICNHVHYLDCVLVDSCFRRKRLYFATLESNFKIPVVRHIIRWLGAMPIPSGAHGMAEFMTAACKAVDRGHYVCLYPEGILDPFYEGVREFRRGAFAVAKRAECPIIPVAVTFRKPVGLRRLYRRKPIPVISVLPPIAQAEVAECPARSLMEIGQERIRRFCEPRKLEQEQEREPLREPEQEVQKEA